MNHDAERSYLRNYVQHRSVGKLGDPGPSVMGGVRDPRQFVINRTPRFPECPRAPCPFLIYVFLSMRNFAEHLVIR